MAFSSAFCVHVSVMAPSGQLPQDLRPWFQDLGDALRQVQRQHGPGPAALLHQLIGSWKALARQTSYKNATGKVFATTYTKQALAARLGRKKRDTVDAYAKTLEKAGIISRGERSRVQGMLDRGVLFVIELSKLFSLLNPFQRKRAEQKAKTTPTAKPAVPKKRLPQGQDTLVLENKPTPCPTSTEATEYAEALEGAGVASLKDKGFKTRFAKMAKCHGYTVKGVSRCARELSANPPRNIKTSLAGVLYARLAGDTFGRDWYDAVNHASEKNAAQQEARRAAKAERDAMEQQEASAKASAWADVVAWWQGLTASAREEWAKQAAKKYRFLPLSDDAAVLGAVAAMRGAVA